MVFGRPVGHSIDIKITKPGGRSYFRARCKCGQEAGWRVYESTARADGEAHIAALAEGFVTTSEFRYNAG